MKDRGLIILDEMLVRCRCWSACGPCQTEVALLARRLKPRLILPLLRRRLPLAAGFQLCQHLAGDFLEGFEDACALKGDCLDYGFVLFA